MLCGKICTHIIIFLRVLKCNNNINNKQTNIYRNEHMLRLTFWNVTLSWRGKNYWPQHPKEKWRRVIWRGEDVVVDVSDGISLSSEWERVKGWELDFLGKVTPENKMAIS